MGQEGKLKELRNLRRISQKIVGQEIGITQQNMSRYENDVCTIPVDMLVKLAEYYNVSTDYILGISEVKRNVEGWERETRTMSDHYDFLEIYRSLSERDKELLWTIALKMKESPESK